MKSSDALREALIQLLNHDDFVCHLVRRASGHMGITTKVYEDLEKEFYGRAMEGFLSMHFDWFSDYYADFDTDIERDEYTRKLRVEWERILSSITNLEEIEV